MEFLLEVVTVACDLVALVLCNK